MPPKRSWTLAAARELLPEVYRRTERAVVEADTLSRQRETSGPSGPEREAIEAHLQRVLDRWTREMEALGLEVKGVWLVDFDNGSGYYCWRWPEPRLEWYHGYQDGFAGRVRIH